MRKDCAIGNFVVIGPMQCLQPLCEIAGISDHALLLDVCLKLYLHGR